MIRNFRRVRCSLPSIYPHPDATAVRHRLTAADRQVGDLTAAPLADFWGCGAGEDLAGVVGRAGRSAPLAGGCAPGTATERRIHRPVSGPRGVHDPGAG